MSFHDDGTAGRERRSRVATRDGKCERKVAGPEHDDRAERHLAHAQIRTRQRLAIRQRRIDAQSHPAAFTKFICEEPQLTDRACPLARESCERQSRFGMRPFEEFIAERHDLLASCFEELRALLRIELAIDVKGRPGKRARLFDILSRSRADRGCRCSPVAGLVAKKDSGPSYTLPANKEFAGYGHESSPVRLAPYW